MDTRPKRSIFLELTERLGSQGQFREWGAIKVHLSRNKGLAHRMVKGFEYCGLDRQFYAAILEEVMQTAEVGPSNSRPHPPLGHARK